MPPILVENSTSGLEPEGIADLFERLIWILVDNGAALVRIVRGWLDEAGDVRRIRIALAMDEVFVYDRRSEMQVLS